MLYSPQFCENIAYLKKDDAESIFLRKEVWELIHFLYGGGPELKIPLMKTTDSVDGRESSEEEQKDFLREASENVTKVEMKF